MMLLKIIAQPFVRKVIQLAFDKRKVAGSGNPVRRKFSRHIDIRRYFVRDMVAAGVLKLVPLRTHLMVADALTKSLPSPAHIKHRGIMLGHVPFSFAARSLRRAIGD
jgi:hypothetical protein